MLNADHAIDVRSPTLKLFLSAFPSIDPCRPIFALRDTLSFLLEVLKPDHLAVEFSYPVKHFAHHPSLSRLSGGRRYRREIGLQLLVQRLSLYHLSEKVSTGQTQKECLNPAPPRLLHTARYPSAQRVFLKHCPRPHSVFLKELENL
jgi:hypothetical protein